MARKILKMPYGRNPESLKGKKYESHGKANNLYSGEGRPDHRSQPLGTARVWLEAVEVGELDMQ